MIQAALLSFKLSQEFLVPFWKGVLGWVEVLPDDDYVVGGLGIYFLNLSLSESVSVFSAQGSFDFFPSVSVNG